eukprot:CAMPEP_0117011652 /NCGR_PEP_ID=MMETSP0472-20121206/9979_1 /TAXON_ID=693140 ORGANISM="Tiarina fusus, Strain LIS" /NCGR_SAMPLE_ID=MMETSP0472 /ASSEMBLY_ACC=CAM_ASM_000603 /LENGTH=96 /DNA_ID=CAMNT_0004714529 /DNA_START=1918 /DNA_END=2205 /DNA_ORIENTATION=+
MKVAAYNISANPWLKSCPLLDADTSEIFSNKSWKPNQNQAKSVLAQPAADDKNESEKIDTEKQNCEEIIDDKKEDNKEVEKEEDKKDEERIQDEKE